MYPQEEILSNAHKLETHHKELYYREEVHQGSIIKNSFLSHKYHN